MKIQSVVLGAAAALVAFSFAGSPAYACNGGCGDDPVANLRNLVKSANKNTNQQDQAQVQMQGQSLDNTNLLSNNASAGASNYAQTGDQKVETSVQGDNVEGSTVYALGITEGPVAAVPSAAPKLERGPSCGETASSSVVLTGSAALRVGLGLFAGSKASQVSILTMVITDPNTAVGQPMRVQSYCSLYDDGTMGSADGASSQKSGCVAVTSIQFVPCGVPVPVASAKLELSKKPVYLPTGKEKLVKKTSKPVKTTCNGKPIPEGYECKPEYAPTKFVDRVVNAGKDVPEVPAPAKK